jgi:two-component system sensor kinase FixL
MDRLESARTEVVMNIGTPVAGKTTSPLLSLVAVLFAVAIFVVDTFTPLGIAVAVLYMVVVLMAGRFFQRPGILVVGFACLLLTTLSYLLQYGEASGPEFVRFLVSVAAISITTFLALRIHSTGMRLREQASLLDITHDAMFVRDFDERITFWNRGAEQLYGWPREEAVGKVSHDLLRTVFPLPLEDIKEALINDDRWEGELVHTRRDGVQVTVASRWSVQRDAGRPIAILETNNDVTERKIAETKAQQAQADLARVSRVTMLGELTASIAHEVNQPLAAAVTNAETSLRWLERNPPELAEARLAIEHIVRDAHRASDVIQRVRNLAINLDPERVPLDLNGAIDEILRLLQSELRRRRASLRLELAPTLPRVLGDRVQLQQVVINLVMNGVEAMAKVDDRPRELRISSRQHDSDQLLIAVQDAGVGIDAAQVDRLFLAFVTSKQGGMGMGLPICKSIIEAHEGKLWASSNDGHGATFQFTLPIYREGSQ